jgi:hypothetical protein
MFGKKDLKKMDVLDVGLVKLSVLTATLFIITIWPAAMSWVHSVNPWYFLIAFLALVARPVYRIYIK